MEEALALRRDGVDGERQRDAESDVVDGMPAGAEINNHHRGSADKYRFNASGYQVGEMGHKVWGVATTNTFVLFIAAIHIHFINNASVCV